jgi:hypothetical protein
MLTNAEQNLVGQYAKERSVEPEVCLAFMAVETNAVTGTLVGGIVKAVIRWEGDYFYRFCSTQVRKQLAVGAGLASSTGGKVPNPSGQAERYAMLEKGKKIDVTAAISACSWGVGQVMGAHWKWLGFASAEEFEKTAQSGFSGQLAIMFAFMDKSGIIPHMRRHDWSAIARIWNGPNYSANKYDTKMRDEYERLTGSASPEPAAAGMLRAGSKGAAVRDLQALLVRAGFSVAVDGDFGTSTQRAVMTWQKQQGLPIDGVAGAQTLGSLQRFKTSSTEKPGAIAVADVPQVKQGLLAGIGGATAITTAKQNIDNGMQSLAEYTGFPAVEHISTILGVLSAVLVIAGLGYGLWGWYKSNHTVVGVEAKAS